MNQKRIGVLLSGCGVKDGTEIHEAVLTLLALDRAGAVPICMAPDKEKADVVDHVTDKTSHEKRNVLAESARIARGNISNLKQVDPNLLDGLIIPGGYGAAKNLCNFATAGEKCVVDPDVAGLLRKLHEQDKPIAALCIAPTVLAGVFGKDLHPTLTVGNDPDTAAKIEKMGAKHEAVEPTQVVIDTENGFITTPCYMTAQSINEIATGTEKAVTALLSLTRVEANV
ncbi:MAG: isoprenoid biosynthesis glyoxalase ElbB [Candidatus Eisenbacteria bacterium]